MTETVNVAASFPVSLSPNNNREWMEWAYSHDYILTAVGEVVLFLVLPRKLQNFEALISASKRASFRLASFIRRTTWASPAPIALFCSPLQTSQSSPPNDNCPGLISRPPFFTRKHPSALYRDAGNFRTFFSPHRSINEECHEGLERHSRPQTLQLFERKDINGIAHDCFSRRLSTNMDKFTEAIPASILLDLFSTESVLQTVPTITPAVSPTEVIGTETQVGEYVYRNWNMAFVEHSAVFAMLLNGLFRADTLEQRQEAFRIFNLYTFSESGRKLQRQLLRAATILKRPGSRPLINLDVVNAFSRAVFEKVDLHYLRQLGILSDDNHELWTLTKAEQSQFNDKREISSLEKYAQDLNLDPGDTHEGIMAMKWLQEASICINDGLFDASEDLSWMFMTYYFLYARFVLRLYQKALDGCIRMRFPSRGRRTQATKPKLENATEYNRGLRCLCELAFKLWLLSHKSPLLERIVMLSLGKIRIGEIEQEANKRQRRDQNRARKQAAEDKDKEPEESVEGNEDAWYSDENDTFKEAESYEHPSSKPSYFDTDYRSNRKFLNILKSFLSQEQITKAARFLKWLKDVSYFYDIIRNWYALADSGTKPTATDISFTILRCPAPNVEEDISWEATIREVSYDLGFTAGKEALLYFLTESGIHKLNSSYSGCCHGEAQLAAARHASHNPASSTSECVAAIADEFKSTPPLIASSKRCCHVCHYILRKLGYQVLEGSYQLHSYVLPTMLNVDIAQEVLGYYQGELKRLMGEMIQIHAARRLRPACPSDPDEEEEEVLPFGRNGPFRH
ncbi:hypothetical protein BJ508DRAFT_306513 [Ascobolus immersus RN42]|uniref:Uncharacterized protein n=1 Tax=Ascobolus immersus RN42 TaxID=1160509 RepID=A0A3N4I7M2_ASCIM|nr:hypothetical protein BJ508DRAFT_306513 [Ascobolus immersus RN42]